MGKLDNRVAIVTGAAQGIGKAVADKLEAEGATVVGADVQSGTTMQADVSKEEDVKRLVEDTVAEHGKLDVLVNVAAIVPFTPWDEVDFAEWRRIMSVNLDGTFLTNHYAQKAMREKGYGRIVNIASNVVLARDVGPHGRPVLDVGADDRRALGLELVRDRLADSLRRAGDDRDPVVELAHVPS